jgi:xylulose-5-phosphate/fructose-6-phosphate phosphoketolase
LPLSAEELRLIHAWWRAANYVSVGQIHLLNNPLLREPLTLEHIKPRLLGHWGTTPGLNLIYAHSKRPPTQTSARHRPRWQCSS